MAVLEVIATTLAARLGGAIWDTASEAVDDWMSGRRLRQKDQLSLSISADGRQSMVPVQNGVLQSASYIRSPAPVLEPIYLSGTFYADPSFIDFAHDILENDEKVVLMFVLDEDSGDVLVGSFDFHGYSLTLPPGLYSLYAFIIDPILDDFLAAGYPSRGELYDPNPIELVGSGPLKMDFFLDELDDDFDDDYDDDWDDDLDY